MEKDKIKYVEPADYFPKHLRKKHKLGEYAEDENSNKVENACKKPNSTSKNT